MVQYLNLVSISISSNTHHFFRIQKAEALDWQYMSKACSNAATLWLPFAACRRICLVLQEIRTGTYQTCHWKKWQVEIILFITIALTVAKIRRLVMNKRQSYPDLCKPRGTREQREHFEYLNSSHRHKSMAPFKKKFQSRIVDGNVTLRSSIGLDISMPLGDSTDYVDVHSPCHVHGLCCSLRPW